MADLASKLRKHILSTYLTLRYGIVAIGALLPVVVYLVGAFNHVPLQKSISAYYWASEYDNDSMDSHSDTGVIDKARLIAHSRDWFVGGLFAVAAFLYLYKGFSSAENVALNLAGALAVGVAVFPMEWKCGAACADKFSVHGFCAVTMFVCLVYVVWFRAADTLLLVPEKNRARYRRIYAIVGLVMLASPVTAFVLNSLLGKRHSYVFFIEAAGIWAFALYWGVKSSELKQSAATVKALGGHVKAAPSPAGGPVTQDATPISDVDEESVSGEHSL
jgi:hypothetical protein